MDRVFPLLAVSLLLSGCLGASDPPAGPDTVADGSDPMQRVHGFKGVFGPTDPAMKRYTFDVPNGTAEVEGLLIWDAPGARLGFTLYGPDGTEAARGWHERDGRAYVTTTHKPIPGEWSVEVETDSVANVAFSLTVTVRDAAVPTGLIETTFTIPPSNPARQIPPEASSVRGPVYQAGARDFAEINLNMADGDWFDFTWKADGELYFNVHYHSEDGTTSRPIEQRTDALEGNYTANWTEVYALLWRNEGPEPVTLTVELEGRYRLHSMSRDG